MRKRSWVLVGLTVIVAAAVIVVPVWWLFDRPFGGATCWVNFTAKTYDQAKVLQADLSGEGLDAEVPGLKDGRPPALPVVTIDGGFWKREETLRKQVLAGVSRVDGGRFDQCSTPQFGG